MTGPSSFLPRCPRLNLASLAISVGSFTVMLTGINFGLVFNYTHSAPFGLYAQISDPRSERRDTQPYAFFCPDVRWPAMKGQPNYRSPMRTCPDGFSPLIKPVVAWPGDLVETSAHGLTINGVFLPNTVPIDHDSKGNAIHPYPYGTYRVAPGEAWTISSFSPRSFDSRYFGPIPLRSVHLWIRPLLVEKKYHPKNR